MFDFLDICTENLLLILPCDFFFKKNSMKIRSLLIFRMFINSLCLYSDFYIYNNLSFISNESCTIQSRLERYKKNCISYSIKKIIVRSNKKIVFRSASSSALY